MIKRFYLLVIYLFEPTVQYDSTDVQQVRQQVSTSLILRALASLNNPFNDPLNVCSITDLFLYQSTFLMNYCCE